MLVGAFQIHVGLERQAGTGEFRASRCDGPGRGSGINPNVERVVGFRGRFGATPFLRLQRRPQFRGGFLEPDVRAVFFDEVSRRVNDASVQDRIALRIVESRDGTPQVRWRLMHQSGRERTAASIRLLPQSDPFDLFNRRQSTSAECVFVTSGR
jgi:hypothetical protein